MGYENINSTASKPKESQPTTNPEEPAYEMVTFTSRQQPASATAQTTPTSGEGGGYYNLNRDAVQQFGSDTANEPDNVNKGTEITQK